ncbi:hypothetical protein [Chryseobacterium taihuense]|uniref:Lipoprotein n=1 Tax=Chryseobacterium taihuense TaxID=1141221 RepID=A0ABY0QYB1_9FLAO|nr:hypothetical protein [Chryseobacterium taihuense]SDM11154.1 hypothetical protein SAMN05216273_11368 [Chryseobacterium taihuense]
MRNTLLLLSLILVFSCEKKSSVKTNSASRNEADKISYVSDSAKISFQNTDEIKAAYTKINQQINAKKLDSTSFNYECNERSGTVVYYSQNGKIRAIRHSFSEYSHYSAVENYFVNNDQPFFIFQQETVWNFDGGTAEQPETKDEITEKRLYYINSKLGKCLEKKYTVRSAEKGKPNPENIKNHESKTCPDKELMKIFTNLMSHKNKKPDCLQ